MRNGEFKVKKNLLIIGAMSLMLAFTGCGSTNSGETSSVAEQKEVNPQELLTSVSDKMAEAKSYEANTVMDMKMAAQGQEVSMSMAMDMKIINSPSVMMQVDSSTEMSMGGENQNIDMTMYIESVDDGYTLYQNVNDVWSKTSLQSEEEIAQYITAPAVTEYANLADSITQGNDETVDGVDCYKLVVNIPASKLGELMSEMGSVGANAESMLANITEGEDFVIEMLVSKADETLVQVDMDLAEMMKSALKGQEGVTEEDLENIVFDMSMNFSNLNAVEEITIPEAAKAA